MTNNNMNIDTVGDSFDNFEKLRKNNVITFPRSWIKCGEVFCNNLQQPTFVCSICLKNADSINTAYTTNDGSLFWWHVQQQHILVDCESLEKLSAEVASCASNNVESKISCDNEISSNVCEDGDFDYDQMAQNQKHLQKKFSENSGKSNNMRDPQECILQNLDTKLETENRLYDTKDVKPNKLNEKDNCNYYYDETATYTCTISDDENDEESNIKWAVRLGGENNVRDYLRHNDMIEISDDEDTEDNIETRPSSPILVDKNTMICEVDNRMEYKTQTNETTKLNESIISHANLVSVIPTPEVSPCDKVTAQDLSSQLQNRFSECSDDSQLKNIQQLSKKRATNFRSFQCELCGIRTINEVNMKTHIEKHHQVICQEFPTSHNQQKHYHQVYQSHQNKQPELAPSYGQKYEKRKNPFKCKSCKTSTKTLKAMERHQLSYHRPDKPLLRQQCHICHKQILVGKFEVHMQLHFTPRFKCNHCKAVYAQKQYLDKHISKYHSEDKNRNEGLENLSQQPKPNNVPFATYATTSLTHQVQQQFNYHKGAHMWGDYMYPNNEMQSQNLQW